MLETYHPQTLWNQNSAAVEVQTHRSCKDSHFVISPSKSTGRMIASGDRERQWGSESNGSCTAEPRTDRAKLQTIFVRLHLLELSWLVTLRYVAYIYRPPLWSSGQIAWLQLQRSGFDFRRWQIFWEVVGLERDPSSLVNTTEELLERKSIGFGLETRDYGRRRYAATDQAIPSTSKSWQ
jgi:hypothetical protein